MSNYINIANLFSEMELFIERENKKVELRFNGTVKDLLKKISDIEKEIKQKDMKWIAHGIDITGDQELANEFDLYNGLSSMEEYLAGSKEGVTYDVEALINTSRKARKEIVDSMSERLTHDLDNLRHQLLEVSVNTSLEIAKNIRLEGGGQISNDMIFDGP